MISDRQIAQRTRPKPLHGEERSVHCITSCAFVLPPRACPRTRHSFPRPRVHTYTHTFTALCMYVATRILARLQITLIHRVPQQPPACTLGPLPAIWPRTLQPFRSPHSASWQYAYISNALPPPSLLRWSASWPAPRRRRRPPRTPACLAPPQSVADSLSDAAPLSHLQRQRAQTHYAWIHEPDMPPHPHTR